jgi:D-aminoacyl-tRNA deacylase
MRIVLQRVSSARVAIEERVAGEIGRGLLVLVGVADGDGESDGQWLAEKIAALRIFPDDAGQMNRTVRDVGGEVLVVSQFTLLASTRKGTRPSFNAAAKPDLARTLYEKFLAQMSTALARPVACGEFGADMKVSLHNDGPVTLILDSRQRE